MSTQIFSKKNTFLQGIFLVYLVCQKMLKFPFLRKNYQLTANLKNP